MSEWISVEDRLPDFRALDIRVCPWTDLVLVFDKKKGVKFASCNKANGNYLSWWTDRGDFDRCSNVTHWMPLPAPPERLVLSEIGGGL